MHNIEHAPTTPERHIEIHASVPEVIEQLKNKETAGEQSPDISGERINEARHEAEAAFAAETGTEHQGQETSGDTGRATHRVTLDEKKTAYAKTMKQIRREMSGPARAFSTFIHNSTVEKTSNVVGTTLARPNAVLSGSTAALILVSFIYITSKIFGYPLSGFETIGAFIVGWIIGIVYDYARSMLGSRSR